MQFFKKITQEVHDIKSRIRTKVRGDVRKQPAENLGTKTSEQPKDYFLTNDDSSNLARYL